MSNFLQLLMDWSTSDIAMKKNIVLIPTENQILAIINSVHLQNKLNRKN